MQFVLSGAHSPHCTAWWQLNCELCHCADVINNNKNTFHHKINVIGGWRALFDKLNVSFLKKGPQVTSFEKGRKWWRTWDRRMWPCRSPSSRPISTSTPLRSSMSTSVGVVKTLYNILLHINACTILFCCLCLMLQSIPNLVCPQEICIFCEKEGICAGMERSGVDPPFSFHAFFWGWFFS